MSHHTRSSSHSTLHSRCRRLHVEALEDRRMLAVFTVTNTNANGPGSLVDALNQANSLSGLDTINFSSAVHGGTITLGNPLELTDTQGYIIEGPGSDLLTISGNNQHRIFVGRDFGSDTGFGSVPIRVSGLTLANGYALGADFGGGSDSNGKTGGGAIISASQILVENTVFINNRTLGDGGAIFGSLVIVQNSKFHGNQALDAGDNSGNGGAIDALRISVGNSEFTENNAQRSGGALSVRSERDVITCTSFLGHGCLGYDSEPYLSVVKSTFSLNHAGYEGGAVYADQLDENNPTVTYHGASVINDSTFSQNSASARGGAIFLSNTGSNTANVIDGSTIVQNTASSGGGVYVLSNNPVNVLGSIIATNVATSGNEVDFRGSGDFEHTFIGNNHGASIPESLSPDLNGNVVGGPNVGILDPLLGPLDFNGGPTRTHSPLFGSPVINAGTPIEVLFPVTETTDQRGFKRFRYQRTDMGAVEFYDYGPRDLIVDNDDDGFDGNFATGELTLREAVLLAGERPGHPTITFDASLHGQTIDLDEGPITIASDLTIEGPGVDLLEVHGRFSPGIFIIDDGRSSDSNVVVSGLTLREVVVLTSGVIQSSEITTVRDVRFLINESKAIHASDGSLRVERSTIDGSGGILAEAGVPVEVVDSTLTRISSVSNEYAIEAHLLTVVNSTIDVNSTFFGAAGIRAHGPAVVRHSTITGNGGTANVAGGGIHFSDTLTLDHTIVAENEGTMGPDLFADGPAALLESDYSVIGSRTGTNLQQTDGTPDARGNLVGGAKPPGGFWVEIDMAAMGGFELDSAPGPYSNDSFQFEYRVDGGPWQPLVASGGSQAVDQFYTLDFGNEVFVEGVESVRGPLVMGSHVLTNQFQTVANFIPFGQEALEFRFTADTTSEPDPFTGEYDDAFAFRNFRLFANGPGGPEITALVTDGADHGGTINWDAVPTTDMTMFGVDTTASVLPDAIEDISQLIMDEQGIIPFDDTSPFFGVVGLQGLPAMANITIDLSEFEFLDPELGPLTDNGGATSTRAPLASSPVINIGDTTLGSEVDSPLNVSVAVAAMGDFEASNDFFVFEYSNDGGPWQTLLEATVEESIDDHPYTLDGGAITLLNDPLSFGGVLLDNDFQTVTATISDPGQEVSIRFRGRSDSNESFVWRDLVVERQSDSVVVGRAVASTASPDVFTSFSSDSDYNIGGDMFGIRSRSDGGELGIPFAVADDSVSIFPADTGGIIGESDQAPFFGVSDNDDAAGNNATWTFYNATHFDQRGDGNGRLFGGRIDAGAVESNLGIIVDSPLDESDGDFSVGNLSLREAIQLANSVPGLSTVLFSSALNGSEIDLSFGQLEITEDLIIDASSLASGLTIDGQLQSRLLQVIGNAQTVTLQGLHLTGGRTIGSDTFDNFIGGAIRKTTTGDLNLIDTTISNSHTLGDGSHGGAIYSAGDVMFDGSLLKSSSTTGAAAKGGALFAIGSITLIESTVSGNSTSGDNADGGAIYAQGGFQTSNSTITGNSTTGFNARGGAVWSNSDLISTQSTISGNSTADANAHGGAIAVFGQTAITFSTITDNHAMHQDVIGGGVWAPSGDITMHHTILAGNTAGLAGPDLQAGAGTITVDYSLIGNTADSGITGATGVGNQLNVSALLGPLQDNGGPTPTHGLLVGSPAANAGNSAINVLAYDQRGVGFPRVVGSDIDIGAFESSGTLSDAVAQTLGLSIAQIADLDTGLLLWLDGNDAATFTASGGTAEWLDKSGNDSSASQTDAAAVPQLNAHWIDFSPDTDGGGTDNDDSLNIALNSAPAGPWTGTVVFEVDGNSSDQGIVNPAPFTAAGFSVTHHFNLAYSYYGNGSNHRNTTADVGQPHAAISAWTGGTNPEDALFWANGDAISNGAGSPVAANDLSSQLTLGDAATPLDGRIGTVIIHSGVLSDTARQQLEGYLHVVWGTPLPAGHPYSAAVEDADFDQDTDVDGADFLAWQRGVGITSGATRAEGDANGDGAVTQADLTVWESQFGTTTSPSAAVASSTPASTVVEDPAASLIDAAIAMEWPGKDDVADDSHALNTYSMLESIFDSSTRTVDDLHDFRAESDTTPSTTADEQRSGDDVGWLAEELLEEVFG